MTDVGRPAEVVEREPVEVAYLAGRDDQAGITDAWGRLEAIVGSLRGRHFFGVVAADRVEYWACVELGPGDDAALAGLGRAVIAGGRYARVRLEGEPPEVYSRIAPGMGALARRPDHDPGRPAVEHYRRRDQIDLLMPVR